MKSICSIAIAFIFFQCNVFSQSPELKGSWIIYRFMPGTIYAMDEKTSKEWVGKKANFNKVLHFPYDEISGYKDVFKQNYCDYAIIESRWIDPAEFEEEYNISMGLMGVRTNLLLILKTACGGTPFESIIVNDKNEIIILWDGVFFYLKRE
jgi:hypothetical protein